MVEFLASDRIQIAIIFSLGFLVSRLFVVTGLAERLVIGWIRRVQDHPARIFLFLLLSASLLSSFIPNMISVLTLLPSLKMLIERLTPQDATRSERRKIATALTCSLIWGANIGGNASLIGSPSNLLLLLFLELLQVPGGEKIGFLNWFGWGIPLVLVFDLLGWLLIVALFRGLRTRTGQPPPRLPPAGGRTRAAVEFSAAICLFSGLVSAISFAFKSVLWVQGLLNGAALMTALAFVWLLFLRPLRSSRNGKRNPLMSPSDLWSKLPLRGLSFAGGVVVIFALLARWSHSSGFDDRLGEWVSGLLPAGASPLPVLLLLSWSTIYLTEFLSNSLVATALFYTASGLAEALAIHPLPLFVAISMASTCAFMTPVATPVNSLAYGEIRHLSIPRMMLAGFVLNLVGGGLIALVCRYLFPAVIGIGLG